MAELTWYEPETLEEALPLLEREGVYPHGGGTFLLMGGLKKVKGLIDLDRLPLRRFQATKSFVELGSSLTYAEVTENIEKTDPGHVLLKALSCAASTPLRNRITVGGTVSSFPAWSDLLGPLVALEAEVVTAGANGGIFPIDRYAKEPALRRKTLVTAVRFARRVWDSYYHREVRTRFDYPAFTVTVLSRRSEEMIEDVRIVVTGCSGKFARLMPLENLFRGKPAKPADGREISKRADVRFPAKKGLDADYLAHCFRVALHRGLAQVTGETPAGEGDV
ncbi:MAG: FAD binding domain-containing protein [Spirochaetes bacterium]|nr:FAD binding domain-containing protein [Spirochaetota bacterium]